MKEPLQGSSCQLSEPPELVGLSNEGESAMMEKSTAVKRRRAPRKKQSQVNYDLPSTGRHEVATTVTMAALPASVIATQTEGKSNLAHQRQAITNERANSRALKQDQSILASSTQVCEKFVAESISPSHPAPSSPLNTNSQSRAARLITMAVRSMVPTASKMLADNPPMTSSTARGESDIAHRNEGTNSIAPSTVASQPIHPQASHSQAFTSASTTSSVYRPTMPLMPNFSEMHSTLYPSFTSPVQSSCANFLSPSSIYRQMDAQHSFLFQDPSPDPTYRQPNTPPMPHKTMIDVPAPTSTIMPRSILTIGSGSLTHGRRLSITQRLFHSDDMHPIEIRNLDDNEEVGHHVLTPKSLMPTPVLTPTLTPRTLQTNTLLSSESVSAASTPSSATTMRMPMQALSLYTPPSSIASTPTSGTPLGPIRRFFPCAPPPVTASVTLVPSPRMESKLQQAGRAHQEATRRLKEQANSNDIHPSGEDDEELTEGGECLVKRRKRPRPGHSRKSSQKKRSKVDSTEPSIETVASTLTSVSRLGRKVVPPNIFGQGETIDTNQNVHTNPHPNPPLNDSSEGVECENGAADESDSTLPKNKVCELCQTKHSGTYGGGRFCCSHCARHYSIIHRWEKRQGR